MFLNLLMVRELAKPTNRLTISIVSPMCQNVWIYVGYVAQTWNNSPQLFGMHVFHREIGNHFLNIWDLY